MQSQKVKLKLKLQKKSSNKCIEMLFPTAGNLLPLIKVDCTLNSTYIVTLTMLWCPVDYNIRFITVAIIVKLLLLLICNTTKTELILRTSILAKLQ